MNAKPRTILDCLKSHCLSQPAKTAYTFLQSDDERVSMSYRELDVRARRIASELLQHAEPGDRALMMYPAGLEFIEAFLGCLYAGIIAVPAYPPKKNRNAERILAIAEDCKPRLLLCTSETKRSIEGEFSMSIAGSSLVATDEPAAPQTGTLPNLSSDQLAFIQYTSGSTASPKGVMVTHGNILANERLIQQHFEFTEETVMISWLPMFHDMGLIGCVLASLFVGCRSVLMAPNTFLREPVKWLRAVTEFRGTCIGAPNFAYDLCEKKITAEQKRTLDLSFLRIAYNGAEPVRAETLTRFSRAFADCGFREEMFFPCYGLAESTLFVAGGPPLTQTATLTVDPAALERHSLVGSQSGHTFVSCGQVGADLQVRIVRPETRVECTADEVGELWLHGPSVTQGYWRRPEETAESYQATLHGDDRYWLRTGDYGFVCDGELFITGRRKDLIIIRGRNLYPQDIESLVEQHLEFVQPNSCAAFSVDQGGEEKLIIVAEGTREMVRWTKCDGEPNEDITSLNEKIDSLRQAILNNFEVALSEIVFVRPTTFPRTSSGKVQRQLAKQQHTAQSSEIVFLVDNVQPAKPNRTENVPPAPCLNPGAEDSGSETNGNGYDETTRKVHGVVLEWLRSEVDPDITHIENNQPFAAMGIDSLATVSLTVALEKAFGCEFPDELLFQLRTINELAAYLQNELYLADKLEIRLASTPEELEAVYRFRYTVYVEEMNRPQRYADHEQRRIVDPLDENGDVFAVWQGDRVVGTVRVNFLRFNPLDEYRNLYGIQHLDQEALANSSITTRLMLTPRLRHTTLAFRLVSAVYRHGIEHGIETDYCDCNAPVLDFFRRIGYRTLRRVEHPEYGNVNVMHLNLTDTDYLSAIGSPLISTSVAHELQIA